jgi:hypothetical protein
MKKTGAKKLSLTVETVKQMGVKSGVQAGYQRPTGGYSICNCKYHTFGVACG